MEIKNIISELTDEFELFDDQMDKYSHLVDMGKNLSPLDDEYKKDEFLVKGCQSKVWLHAFEKNGRVFFEADSNTAITKGIVALLIRVFSGQQPENIIQEKMDFIDRIGLRSHLSSQRSNGLNAMIKEMKLFAKAIKQKQEVKS